MLCLFKEATKPFFTYCLVAIVGDKLNADRTIYEILKIFSISLLDKTSVKEVLTDYDYKNVKELNYKQSTIRDFRCPVV